jgi:hypothetical protein
MGKTHSKLLAARHGRGTAWARHAMCESAFRVQSWTAGQTWRTNPSVSLYTFVKIVHEVMHHHHCRHFRCFCLSLQCTSHNISLYLSKPKLSYSFLSTFTATLTRWWIKITKFPVKLDAANLSYPFLSTFTATLTRRWIKITKFTVKLSNANLSSLLLQPHSQENVPKFTKFPATLVDAILCTNQNQ